MNNFTYHVTFQWLPLHSEQKQSFTMTEHLLWSPPLPYPTELIICHFPLCSLHFSLVASFLHLLSVPCTWNSLPRESDGSFLPFFRSLPKCHLLREALPAHPIQNITLMTYHMVEIMCGTVVLKRDPRPAASTSPGTMFLGLFFRPESELGLGPAICIKEPCNDTDDSQM